VGEANKRAPKEIRIQLAIEKKLKDEEVRLAAQELRKKKEREQNRLNRDREIFVENYLEANVLEMKPNTFYTIDALGESVSIFSGFLDDVTKFKCVFGDNREKIIYQMEQMEDGTYYAKELKHMTKSRRGIGIVGMALPIILAATALRS